MRFDKCEHPECGGHSAKFDNCLSEALYCWDQWDDTSGDVDYGTTVGLIISHESFTIPAGESGLMFDLNVAGPLFAMQDVSSDGLVSLRAWDTEEDARAGFDRFTYHYDLYLESVEGVNV